MLSLSSRSLTSEGVVLPALSVTDWPDIPRRIGHVRIHAGCDMPFIKQYIDNMILWKMNALLIEFQYGLKLPEFPELDNGSERGSSVTEAELKDFAAYLSARRVELIPSWHCGKLLGAKADSAYVQKYPGLKSIVLKNPQFAKEDNYKNYDISLPEAFDFNIKKCDYFLKLTGAKTIFIGLDEIMHFSEFAAVDQGKGDVILSTYVNRFIKHYAPQGVTTGIYQDLLLTKETGFGPPANASGGSEKALALFQPSTHFEIFHWQYSPLEEYPGFSYFKRNGFSTVPVMWFEQENIDGFTRYAYKAGSGSAMSSIWCMIAANPERAWELRGRYSSTDRFPTERFLPAVHYSAERFWNALRPLDYDAVFETLRSYDSRTLPVPAADSILPVDLSGARNTQCSFVNASVGSADGAKRVMKFSPPTSGDNAVSVRGLHTKTLPETVGPIALPAGRSILFLHGYSTADSIPANPDLGCAYLVTHQSGAVSEIKLAGDNNILPGTVPLKRFSTANTNLWVAWCGYAPDQKRFAVYAYEWGNPRTGDAPVSLSLKSTHPGLSSVFLFGATVIR